MENQRMQSNNSVKQELEYQLRSALVEIKTLKKENQNLYQTCSQLKEKQTLGLRNQEIINDLEAKYKQVIQQNKALETELAFCQDCLQGNQLSQANNPKYQQLQNELEDIQKYFKQYFVFQDELINQLPLQLLRECWQGMNTAFKSSFNCHQLMQSETEELGAMELEYKQLVHQPALKEKNQLSDLARQSKINDLRLEIEKTRKDIQMNQLELKQTNTEISELQKEFSYLCKIELRRLNHTIEQEKQIIGLKLKTDHRETECRIRQQSDYFKPNKSVIQFKATKLSDEAIHQCSQEDTSQIEKTIEQTRKKLSRQLSQASNIKQKQF